MSLCKSVILDDNTQKNTKSSNVAGPCNLDSGTENWSQLEQEGWEEVELTENKSAVCIIEVHKMAIYIFER